MQELPPLAAAQVDASAFAAAHALFSASVGDPPDGAQTPAQKDPTVVHVTGVVRPDAVSGQYMPMGHGAQAGLASAAVYLPPAHAVHSVGLVTLKPGPHTFAMASAPYGPQSAVFAPFLALALTKMSPEIDHERV